MTSDRFNLSLIQSARLGNERQVRAALAKGAQINATDSQGTTALMFAAQRGFVQIVDLLIAAGADLDLHRRQYGTTALMFAAAANRIDVCDRLLANGADLDAINEDGSNALMGAALVGAKEIVALAIAAGANVRQIDRDGDNALNIAIVQNHTSNYSPITRCGCRCSLSAQRWQNSIDAHSRAGRYYDSQSIISCWGKSSRSR